MPLTLFAPPVTIPSTPATGADAEFARIVDELTRRGFLTGAAASATLIGLTACGSGGGSDDHTTAAAKRSVSTIHGNVDVPAEPARVVALDFPEGCALLDLGLTPVGRPNYMPNFPSYTSRLSGAAVVTDADGKPLLEKIAALQPDLIVTADWTDPSKQQMPYDKLSAIAPTAIFTWEQSAGNWQAQAAATGDAINKTSALNALRGKYSSRSAQIAKDNAALLGSTSWDLIDAFATGWDLYGGASSHGQVLTEAGVRLGAGKKVSGGYQEYSFERFDLLHDTDVIVTTSASKPFLDKQATFAALPAVKAGRVYVTDLYFPASYGIALALLDALASFCTKVDAA